MKVPLNPGRVLDAIGVVAVISATPLWSTLHPAASVGALSAGVLLVAVEPATMFARPTPWSWVLRILGIAFAVSAVSIWLNANPLLGLPLLAAGLAMTVFGSMLNPLPETGANFARFTMESTYDSPGNMVKPPGKNVGDPLEGDDGRFRGR